MDSFSIGGSSFSFSGVGVDDLGATEYTLVVLAVDTSASVGPFAPEIRGCIKNVVESCRKSPRADNLLLRVVTFDKSVVEFHGFKELAQINASDYENIDCIGPRTALFDAAYTAIGSVDEYGRKLVEDDFAANAIVVVITDGADNSSSVSASAVASKAKEARGAAGGPSAEEGVESLLTLLIGVNVNNVYTKDALSSFKTDGDFDQYIEVDNASPKTLAKLAKFVSQSISSQSVALGTGGASQALTF